MSAAMISVIVPVYNGAAFLRQALETVVGQTRPPDEVIVIDDESTDSSAQIVATFPAVRYLHSPNRGPASARNVGITASKGEFLAFIDQDDLWHREKLQRQIACFQQDSGLDLCYSLVDLFWDSSLAVEADRFRDHPRTRSVPGYTMPTLLTRRSAFDRIGPLDTNLRYGDGTEWAMRAMRAGLHIKLLPQVLLYHRMHEANLTRQRDPSEREFLQIIRAHLLHVRSDERLQER